MQWKGSSGSFVWEVDLSLAAASAQLEYDLPSGVAVKCSLSGSPKAVAVAVLEVLKKDLPAEAGLIGEIETFVQGS